METVDMKWVSLKLSVLLLLTTAARGSEIAALTVKGLLFSAAGQQATLYPDLNFEPKTCYKSAEYGACGVSRFLPLTKDEGGEALPPILPSARPEDLPHAHCAYPTVGQAAGVLSCRVW